MDYGDNSWEFYGPWLLGARQKPLSDAILNKSSRLWDILQKECAHGQHEQGCCEIHVPWVSEFNGKARLDDLNVYSENVFERSPEEKFQQKLKSLR